VLENRLRDPHEILAAPVNLSLHLGFEFIYGWHGNFCGYKLVAWWADCSKGLEKGKREPYIQEGCRAEYPQHRPYACAVLFARIQEAIV